MSENHLDSNGDEGQGCSCPFCDAPADKLYPFCKDCGKVLNHCRVCGKPVPPHRDVCAECEG